MVVKILEFFLVYDLDVIPDLDVFIDNSFFYNAIPADTEKRRAAFFC